MSNPVYEIERNVKVGIYDNCTDVARVYPDRTVCHISTVRWVGNTGGYHCAKVRITGRAHEDILNAMADDCEDTAWDIIDARDGR